LIGLSGERPKEFFVTTPIAGLHAAKEVSVIVLTGEVLLKVKERLRCDLNEDGIVSTPWHILSQPAIILLATMRIYFFCIYLPSRHQ
jgi:hypothetical protein